MLSKDLQKANLGSSNAHGIPKACAEPKYRCGFELRIWYPEIASAKKCWRTICLFYHSTPLHPKSRAFAKGLGGYHTTVVKRLMREEC